MIVNVGTQLLVLTGIQSKLGLNPVNPADFFFLFQFLFFVFVVVMGLN